MSENTDASAQDQAEDPTTAAVRTEVRDWLNGNWDPDLTVAEWWDRLAEAHWAVPTWPSAWFGRDLSRGDAGVVIAEIKAAGALQAPADSV